MSQHIPTGVPGLDEILNGGLIEGRSYLIVGAAGTGKTTLSLQWLLDGQRRGEQGMYITLAEPSVEIANNAASFGWDMAGVVMVDLSPSGEPDEELSSEYHVFPPSEVEHVSIWQGIYRALRDGRPRRVVIDSVTQLRYLSTDEYQFRKHVLGLVAFLNRLGCGAFLLFEPSHLEQETSLALAVDGVIRLRMDISPSFAVGLRSLQVEKLRGSDFMSGLHPMQITADGVRAFPHRVERAGQPQPGKQMIASGIAPLDDLLGGGLESGTTTLLSGPAGVGKSSLGTQFLAHNARSCRAALFTFEESVNYILIRSRGIGTPLEELIAAGSLKIVRVNPMELLPDQFLSIVRDTVEREGVKIMMIDSLRGYQLAMAEFGTPLAHIHNLVLYLTRHEVTTLLTDEVEHVSGTLRVTEHGVSHLADNIILMRYAEFDGQMIKVIGCLKKRLGSFQSELRQLQITPAGLIVGEKLTRLSGVLSGSPVVYSSAQNP